MDGDQKYVAFPEVIALAVHAADTLLQSNVIILGDQQFGIISAIAEMSDHGSGNDTRIGIFPESTIRRTLTFCVAAMAVVN